MRMENKFSEVLTILRKRAGISQADFADEVGVSVDTVRRWEGGTQEPRLGELRNISEALGMSIGQLTDNVVVENINREGDMKRARLRKKNVNTGKLIVLQQGNTRIEIPATERGYSLLEKKLNNVGVGEIAIAPEELAVAR